MLIYTLIPTAGGYVLARLLPDRSDIIARSHSRRNLIRRMDREIGYIEQLGCDARILLVDESE